MATSRSRGSPAADERNATNVIAGSTGGGEIATATKGSSGSGPSALRSTMGFAAGSERSGETRDSPEGEGRETGSCRP
jgi:hypothetical protein